MATKQQHTPAPPIAKWEPSNERVSLALNAAYDIEACVDAMLDRLRGGDLGAEDSAVFMALALRIHRLDCVVMGALGDQEDQLDALHQRFAGTE